MKNKVIKSNEHTTVQVPILEYAQEAGWQYLTQQEAEELRRFDKSAVGYREKARKASLFFDDILHDWVVKHNPKFEQSKMELVRILSTLQTNITGNKDFLMYLREAKTFYNEEDKREYNLKLIDLDNPANNVYHVTEEFSYFNGKHLNREDVVFLINGIPVLVIECKNITKEDALSLAIDQLRRYHEETPELMIPQQLVIATESLGFMYGVTWNLTRRNLFDWKHEQIGDLEGKIKSFCDIKHILSTIKDYIIFVEKDEGLNKYILKQHQTAAIDKVCERALDTTKKRGLVWHTQGSGKTFTIIKCAELLFKAPKAAKPTILLIIDRNELEDQMIRNLAALGIEHVEHASSIMNLEKLLKDDYRGIIVSTIHKFNGLKANINTRDNIYVLIDEAHRTTGGDLGTYLMGAIPNASLIGFTGTPIDQTAYGKGTFKIFGIDDEKGYLHKYSITESIEDGTTLPLFYSLAPNNLLVPSKVLEDEFLKLALDEEIRDIDELNEILSKAVHTKTFLKANQRIDTVAKYVAEHYQNNVEPLGYKAFLVAVDRESCVLYKQALDKYLPAEYSVAVYTGNNNDTGLLRDMTLSPEKEKQVRKDFANLDKQPKILIVTEKLLTGYDAPCLYAMYLDKPMKGHTLLQALARVNRPFISLEAGKDKVKPHGFVLDFIGIFDKLSLALTLDAKEVNAFVKDLKVIKELFKEKIEKDVQPYLTLMTYPFDQKAKEALIKHFQDKAKREELFKLYTEVEMLYEVIAPDDFLRPYLDAYRQFSEVYTIIRRAFAKRIYTDKEFLRKTEKLIRETVDIEGLTQDIFEFFELNENTIQKIQESNHSDEVKVINLIKTIHKAAEDATDDLFLLSMKEKAEEVQLSYENKQLTTNEALQEMAQMVEEDLKRQKRQAEKDFDSLTLYIYDHIREQSFKKPEVIIQSIKNAFIKYPNWKKSNKELRELRNEVYYSILENDQEIETKKVTDFVKGLFESLFKTYDI